MEAEQFHRSLLRCQLPAEYYAERDAIETELVKLSRTASVADMTELSKYTLDKESAFIEKWKSIKFEKGKTSLVFRKNWKTKNMNL